MLELSKILQVEEALKLRLVTAHFEIVHWLFVHGPTNSRELARETKVSPANFQIILKRLREDGVVTTEVEDADRRRRRYALAPEIRKKLAAVDFQVGANPAADTLG
jgi:DNA-binding MarR family transcriptional regulator